MKHKKRRGPGAGRTIRDLVAQPPNDFYKQAVLHINCSGQVEIENCREILEYTPERLRLDMGRWDVELWGSDLVLCSVGGPVLTLQGRVFKTEFFYKEHTT